MWWTLVHSWPGWRGRAGKRPACSSSVSEVSERKAAEQSGRSDVLALFRQGQSPEESLGTTDISMAHVQGRHANWRGGLYGFLKPLL